MNQEQLNILVVDDVPAMRESIGAALTAAGHRPSYAENGKDALERILANTFDAVVTDLWMPGMDGLSLIKRIRQEQVSLRVFAITGGGPRLTLEAATSIAEIWGAEKVFLKPFDETLLIEALAEPT
jgi:two-component system chemotaxis response regulator CheY